VGSGGHAFEKVWKSSSYIKPKSTSKRKKKKEKKKTEAEKVNKITRKDANMYMRRKKLAYNKHALIIFNTRF
jgi:hypothetical protein